MPLTTTGGSLEEITAGREGRPQRGTRQAALTRHLCPLQVPEVLHCHFQNVCLLQFGMPRTLHRRGGKEESEIPANSLGVLGVLPPAAAQTFPDPSQRGQALPPQKKQCWRGRSADDGVSFLVVPEKWHFFFFLIEKRQNYSLTSFLRASKISVFSWLRLSFILALRLFSMIGFDDCKEIKTNPEFPWDLPFPPGFPRDKSPQLQLNFLGLQRDTGTALTFLCSDAVFGLSGVVLTLAGVAATGDEEFFSIISAGIFCFFFFFNP